MATQQFKLRKLKREFLLPDTNHVSGAQSRLSSEQPTARKLGNNTPSESKGNKIRQSERHNAKNTSNFSHDAYRIKQDMNMKKAAQTIDGWLSSATKLQTAQNHHMTMNSKASQNEKLDIIRLNNSGATCYGKPSKDNDAVIKDLVNNNYQVEFMQQ